MRSLEQRLYEAWRLGTGVRLSIDEVESLMNRDDAIRTRIANVACAEAGVDECGCDILGGSRTAPPWKQLVRRLSDG